MRYKVKPLTVEDHIYVAIGMVAVLVIIGLLAIYLAPLFWLVLVGGIFKILGR